jgi:lysophospholipase L1-like esterase
MGIENRMTTSWFRRVLALSIALNVVAVVGSVALVQKKGGLAWVSRQAPKVWGTVYQKPVQTDYPNTTLDVYGQLSIGRDDIVLFGDDVFAYGGWHELLADPRVKNRAIARDDTRLLLERIGPIVAGGPRHVVVSCGSFNIQRRTTLTQTAAEYERIVTRLTSRRPDADVWLLPVLPVNRRLYQRWVATDDPNVHRPARRDVEALNRIIRALADRHPRVHFVDLGELVDPAGELRREYTLDGLHRLRQELPRNPDGPLK